MRYEEGDYIVDVDKFVNHSFFGMRLYVFSYTLIYKGKEISSENGIDSEAKALSAAARDIVRHKCSIIELQEAVEGVNFDY